MIAETLLRLGHASTAADYLRWYAPHQFANGKVPCCIDARGADPVPENDSPGEFIFLAGEVYRYTHDRALLAQMWPRVEAATRYMEKLRQSERREGARKWRAHCDVRPAAGIDQPRGLFREADALVLGRLLGAEGLRERGDDGRRAGSPGRRAASSLRRGTNFAAMSSHRCA